MNAPDFMPSVEPVRAYVRWDQRDYVGLLCLAREHGKPPSEPFIDACMEIMQKLPHHERLTRESLRLRLTKSNMAVPQAALKQVERLGEAERRDYGARWLALKEPIPDNTQVRWTHLEKLLMARRVGYWQRDLGDTRPISRLIMEAQRYELHPNRWRNENSLGAGLSAAERDRWQAMTVESLSAPELAHLPFDPAAFPRTPDRPGQATPPPAPEPQEELFTPPAEPEPPPRSLLDMVAAAEPTAPPPRKPQEPLEAARATLGLPPPGKSLLGAPSDFAGHLLLGLEGLVDMIAERAVAHLELRQRRTQEHLAEKVLQIMDERMEARIRRMTEALVGPGPVPGGALEEPLPEMKGEGLDEVIKLDVVGLTGQQITEVKRALNGHADGVRFIDPSQLNAWAPRDIVLINARMGLGVAERKCQKTKSHVHRFWGTANSALKTITEIYEKQGIPLGGHT